MVKKEDPDGSHFKQEPMDVEEKVEVKPEPKEEDEEGGANGSTSSAPASQSRRKSKNAAPSRSLCPGWRVSSPGRFRLCD